MCRGTVGQTNQVNFLEYTLNSVKSLLGQNKGRYVVSVFLWDKHMSVFQKVEGERIEIEEGQEPRLVKDYTFKVRVFYQRKQS